MKNSEDKASLQQYQDQFAVTNKIAHQMEILEKKYDQLSMSLVRPNTASNGKNNKSGLDSYIRKGIIDNVGHIKSEDTDDDRNLIASEIYRHIVPRMQKFSCLRELVEVGSTTGNSMNVMISNDIQCSWGLSDDSISPKSTNTDVVTINLHDLCACPEISIEMVNDHNIDVVNWVIGRFAQWFAQKEEEAVLSYINRTPSLPGMPDSIVNHYIGIHDGDDQAKKAARITEFETLELNTLYEALSKLDLQHRQNAKFLMHPMTLSYLRTKKDSNGRFLIEPASSTNDESLFGIPIKFSNYLTPVDSEGKTSETKKIVILLGDFKCAYHLVEKVPFDEVVRDYYSKKSRLSMFARRKIGGKIINENALCAIISDKKSGE